MVSSSVDILLVHTYKLRKFKDIDPLKPWKGRTLDEEILLPNSIIPLPDSILAESGSVIKTASTRASLITKNDLEYMTGWIIVDDEDGRHYSVTGFTRLYWPTTNLYWLTRVHLQHVARI